jgi:hypothetical protein
MLAHKNLITNLFLSLLKCISQQTPSQLWISGKASTRLCSLQRIATNNIPLKQQVVGMACDAFWIEKNTCIFSTSHGPSS